jgi:predicted enzyme related to lactoylglutathione lyase
VEKTSYEPGIPSWADVGAPDVAAATAFYTGLFGWEAEDQGEEAGHYTMFRQGGKNVAACGPNMGDNPPAWTTYISTADVDATVAAVRDNGGMVFMEPMDVMTAGRMAIAADPTGAVFGLWQAKDHIGAELVNEPVAITWNELNSRDTEASGAFYRAVFGWGGAEEAYGDSSYTQWDVGGSPIGGMAPMSPETPDGVPSHWLVYFSVDDTDGVAARASELGGTVQVPPMDIPPGRFAVIADPGGATFAIIKTAPEYTG